MFKPETHRKVPHPRTEKVECCIDAKCESGLRNNYFEGKRLTPDSFRVEQHYSVERRRLLNRAIHGWGVVYGYAIRSAPPNASGRLEIGPGLALDQCGRELVQAGTLVRGFDDVIVLDEKGTRIYPSPDWDPEATPKSVPKRDPPQAYRPQRLQDLEVDPNPDPRPYPPQDPRPSPTPTRACWLLSVHYAEQAIGPVVINDPCSCERDEWDHVCETVRYSLQRIDCDKCCNDFPCELACDCRSGPCCDEDETHDDGKYDQAVEKQNPAVERREPGHQRKPCKPFTRGGCQCLCEHLTGLQPGDECCSLCEIEEPCARVRVDLRHGVPLACVWLVRDDCNRWTFDTEVEACGPRRLVKRNDLLYDLIRGCDLTRISAIGWAKWHRSDSAVRWPDFAASFGKEDPADSGRNVTRDYWVEFSRPVRADTVRADCFAMTILVAEDEAGWWEVRRVPILDVNTSGGSGGHITRATLVVDAGWVHDATVSRKTIFNQDEALVEIEVFGDYIVDCNGQTVDANVRGLCAIPSGNGTPGGTLRSNFRVEVRDPQVRTPPYDTRVQGA